MLQRIVSGAFVAVLLVVAVLWLPPLWSVSVLSLVLLAAAWELGGIIAAGSRVARVLFIALACGLCLLCWEISRAPGGLLLLLWAALLFWIAAAISVFAAPARIRMPAVMLGGLLALALAWVALVRMRLDWPQGHLAVLYALLVVWLADSGAYFAGRTWGRRKLAPSVSPGKTWAGLWGGLAACALLALLVALWRGLPPVQLLAVTLVVGIFSVVGDLAESLAKRLAGVKDSGSLIPGHGGVLDRFDSLLAAAPLLMLGMQLLPELRA